DGVEAPVGEGEGHDAAAGDPHPAREAEAQGLVREVEADRAPEGAEVREVVAGAAAGVEDAPLRRGAVRPTRGEERQADGAHPRVPPLPLLRLVHPAVFLDVHGRSRALTLTASTTAREPGARASTTSLGPRTSRSAGTRKATSSSPSVREARACAVPFTSTTSVPDPWTVRRTSAGRGSTAGRNSRARPPSISRQTAGPHGWRTLHPSASAAPSVSGRPRSRRVPSPER